MKPSSTVLDHSDPYRHEVMRNHISLQCRHKFAPAHRDLPHFGSFEIVKILLEKGANAVAPNENGWTPLHLAGHFKVVKILLEEGANKKAAILEI